MTVEERRQGPNGSLVALVYTDAQQLIGVDETLSLESALLDAALLGVPTPTSVTDSDSFNFTSGWGCCCIGLVTSMTRLRPATSSAWIGRIIDWQKT